MNTLSLLLQIIVPLLGGILALLLLLPTIAVDVRRLHDTGHSGFWLLLMFIPIANFYVIYLLIKDSEGDNEYGKNPKRSF